MIKPSLTFNGQFYFFPYVALLFSFLTPAHSAESQAVDAIQLSAEGKYEKVVDILKNSHWDATSDPRLLLNYCWASYRLSDQSPTCKIRSDAPINAKLFADALWKAWTGRINQARANLGKFEKNTKWAWFGRFGKMEIASYLENEHELGSLLEQYGPMLASAPPTVRYTFERYRSSYADLSADWSWCSTIEKQYSAAEIGSRMDLFSTCFNRFHSIGDLSRLSALVSSASPNLLRLPKFRELNSEYIGMVKTPKTAEVLYENLATRNPQDRLLKLEAAFLDAYSDKPEISSRAMKTFKSVANSRHLDPKLILGMALTAAVVHKPKDAGEIFLNLNSQSMDLDEFLDYRIMLAWNSVYNGDLNAAQSRVNKLAQDAPHSASVNLLKALIAKRMNDPKAGGDALRVLFSIDPFDENYVLLVIWFSERFNTPEIQELLRQAKMQSQFYSEELQNKLATVRTP